MGRRDRSRREGKAKGREDAGQRQGQDAGQRQSTGQKKAGVGTGAGAG